MLRNTLALANHNVPLRESTICISAHYDNPQEGHGGVFAAYKYYPIQTANGFLDILKGVFKFLAPIRMSAPGGMVRGLAEKRDQGATWKDAAKAGLRAAGGDPVRSFGNQVGKNPRLKAMSDDL